MKLVNATSSRLRAVLCAVAFAIGGSAIAASPAGAAPTAPAAEDLRHCAIVLPYTGNVKCFATVEEAGQFGEEGPPKDPQSSDATFAAGPGARSAGSAAVVLTKLSVEYQYTFWNLFNLNGRSLTIYGTAGPCTTATTDTDYVMSSMPIINGFDWHNRVSSFQTFSNCWTQHYDGVNWGGNFVGYQGSQLAIAGLLDDDTSSMKWS